MKKLLRLVLTVFCAVTCIHQTAEASDMTTLPSTPPAGIFALGEPLQNSHFTGRAWLKMLVEDASYNCPIGNVTFEPGCRNSWHKHPGGQILLVTSGQGYYQERGKKAQLLRAGDTVTIPSQVEHWHGATADSWFSHLAISTNPQSGIVTWQEPVSAEVYAAAAAPETER